MSAQSAFLIAAAHKSSGKTVVSAGIAAALAARGRVVQSFKKGPDYIDPMWLAAASGRSCFNLDFNTMGRDEIAALFAARASGADIAMVEANKGLYDGLSLDGSDSNAELAKLLNLPVVLVVDCAGMTRGIAPLLLGYQAFDAGVRMAGVILNRIGGARHEGKLRAAVETYTDLTVLGAIANTAALDIGERHLGLTTPAETGGVGDRIAAFAGVIGQSVDLDRLEAFPRLSAAPAPARAKSGGDLRIAIARDTAFGFYYPDDLGAFADCGAELVPFDALRDTALPEADGVFIGGGFPETAMRDLSANRGLRRSLAAALAGGLPAYAECGGLMYLCRSLRWRGERHEMIGAIDGDAVMYDRPQGRGYVRFRRTAAHPWGGAGTEVAAHEFHYARIENLAPGRTFARHMLRGAGISGSGDGIVRKNLVAGFCHLRASRANNWVRDFTDFVRKTKAGRGSTRRG